MMPDGSSQGTGGLGQTEEFKLLDIDAAAAAASTASTSYSSEFIDTTQPKANEDVPLSKRISRVAFTGLNMFVSCSALAIAKQIINPANYSQTDEAAKEATRNLPDWFANQYKNKRMASDLTRNILKDTSVLMATTATWYGVQTGMRVIRGKDDAVNVCAAGTLSAALLGAAFIEPFKLSRVGSWAAVGGLAGYLGYQEQQKLKAALLERQQELEQKHMHRSADEVHVKLDSKLLRQLVEMEQKEQQRQFKARMKKEVDASKADAEASSSENWQSLINTPPWLQDQQLVEDGGDSFSQQQQQQQQQAGDRSSRY